MKFSTIVFTVLMMAIGIPAAGQSTAGPAGAQGSSSSASIASGSTAPALQKRHPRYRLRKGDSFEVDFAFASELNQTVAVQPDGYVTLKEIGSVLVEGQTVPELTAMLKTDYAKILHDPVITVVLKDFEKPYFIASGQVTRPGKYDLRGPLTVTEAIAIAGGFNDNAKHSQVVLFRPMPGGVFEAKLINVKKLLASRNLNEDMYVRPGDLLYVPKSAFSMFRRFIPSSSMGAYYNPAY